MVNGKDPELDSDPNLSSEDSFKMSSTFFENTDIFLVKDAFQKFSPQQAKNFLMSTGK